MFVSVFFLTLRQAPRSTLFPYTTLFRSITVLRLYAKVLRQIGTAFSQAYMEDALGGHAEIACRLVRLFEIRTRDRKSTRLNSSHTVISYAVFCLKKKKLRSDVTSSAHLS